ncbi:PMS1 protein homolog 1-like [Adelges cooleyi]|uniref:PMS1 protein homolog 1-like n=1 Tax=Adelges cooleyi TaxID=133065 RepID=UPI00218060F4|nr:PMS1 protein homolog 1-like [Adelges cooleyi]
MPVKQLSSATIKLISSTQVITSASSVVKELLENAIDAQSTVIDIRIENYGLDKIEIRDNGVGISCEDVHVMCLRGYTSKISDVSDLEKLSSYGFRGEALSSICAVADVSVITKTDQDKYANLYTMDKNGHVIKSSISHHQKGTVIKIVDLFKKLPVRKQMYSSKKHCVNDLRKIENVVKALAAIQPNLRVSLVHNKSVLWQMTAVNDLILAFGQIWSSIMTKCFKHLTFLNNRIKIEMILPIQNIDVQNTFLTTTLADAIYLYVNKRPVRDNKIEKLIVGELTNYFGHYLPTGKYLPCLVSINVPAEDIDVNLEPDKSRLFFHNQEDILISIKNCIVQHYYDNTPVNDPSDQNKNILKSNKRKISSDSEDVEVKKSTAYYNEPNQLSLDSSHNNSSINPCTFKAAQLELDSLNQISQIDKSLKPNAESTKIMNDNLCIFDPDIDKSNYKISRESSTREFSKSTLKSEIENSQLVKDLSLEEIDFEEPFTLVEENDSKITHSESNESLINSNIDQYKQRIMNIGITKSHPAIQQHDTSDSSVDFHVKNVTLSQWSKGNVLFNGKPVKCGVSVITDTLPSDKSLENKNDISSSNVVECTQISKEISETGRENLSETVQSGSQMGHKEMSGFTIFAKKMRIKILEENPGLDFVKVSKELAKSWASLSVEEKENYKTFRNKQKEKALVNCINNSNLDCTKHNSNYDEDNSSIKIAPLFRMVAVPDEQVPGLDHLVSRPQSWVPQPRSKRPIQETARVNLSETIQSVSSQMGNREMSGFTLFAKKMRLKILNENPGLDFIKVSKELAKSWASLSVEEKEHYKTNANKQKKKALVKVDEIKPQNKDFKFLFKNLKRHSTLVNVELSEIKERLLKKPKTPFSDYTLIGQIDENCWICRIRNKIEALNICRLQEAVVFRKKLAMDSIPLKMLDQPIIIDKNFLGEKNYQFLMDLDTSYEPSTDTYTVIDDRITKNGFVVVSKFYGDKKYPILKITDVALHISIYGLEEFKQIIELMQTQQSNCLHICRPLKVVNYLRSETVRFCKTSGLPKSNKEINDLLVFWFKHEESFSQNICVHYDNVFTSIHKLTEFSDLSDAIL